MRKCLVGAVARIYEPGVKFDYMLIINGPQGIGKSTFFGKLAGDWFSDSLTMTDMKDKTGAELLQGYWIMEVGEMSGMKKADIETVKSFISRRDDIYRRAYGRFVERHPRQSIIVGSTNSESGFLRDITGNRRFWPVKAAKHAKKKPWDMTAEEVAQIWAEAKVRYDEGEGLILSHEAEEIAREAQREAMEEDPRMAQVEDYLDRLLPDKWYDMTVDERRDWLGSSEDFGEEGIRRRDFISYAEIWVECFNKKKEDMRPQDSYAIAAIMTKMPGWEKSATRKKLKGYGIQRVYVRVGDKGNKGDNFDSTFNF
jgi:putative DNA primase/helicase